MKRPVRVDGLKDLDRALGNLSKATARNTLKRVGVAAMQPFDRSWRAKAGAFKLTGAMAESGGVGTKLTKRQAGRHRKTMMVEVFAGPNDPAALQNEFGNEHQAPQPSVRPAWEEEGDATLVRVGEALGTEITKAAARQAKRLARLGR